MARKYPSEMRRRARKLVRMGLAKTDVSKTMKVSYNTVFLWTKDLRCKLGKPGISGTSLKFLKTIASRGYILSREVKEMYKCMRTLGKYLPMKRVEFSNIVVWCLVGKERDAMEAMLKAMNRKAISYSELSRIRRLFGIKDIKRKIKLRRFGHA